ncbi:hypothetical protein NBRC116494_02710 [Aurantivibrio plasticivorans]
MELDAFCQRVRDNYPDISSRADALYDAYWNDLVDTEFSSHSWFESLANALNDEMSKRRPIQDYGPLLNAISQAFECGSDELKNTIDVAFVENLFWQVGPNDSEPFWHILPVNLRALYIAFHGRAPG